MNIEERNLHHLRRAVCEQFGREVNTSVHCNELSVAIQKDGILINPQTFRRFFGLIKTHGGFSNFTLDALAFYCGHADFSAYKKTLIENELELFLDEIGRTRSKDNYWKISDDLCRKIIESPSLLVSVHHKLLKYPLARTFFMEHHPIRDLAGTVYSQYFKDYLKYENSNEAKLFAYGFLYMGAFLTENEEFMDLYYQKIKEIELTPEIYILPVGRKFGVMLLHSHFRKDDETFDKVFSQMVAVRENYRETSEKSVCSFEYAVLEHLIFTDKTQEMLFLIDNNITQLYSDKKFIPQDRKENHEECWSIMCAVAYLKMKDYKKSKNYLDKVNLENLSLGWQKYYAIQYYIVKYIFSNPSEKEVILNKLTELIDATHFDYYSNILAILEGRTSRKLNSELMSK
ncbi:hypothetical protein [Chryseobacterium sp. MP_3.2]|uniref:hypothetical protein n=1 Tax=Chryseobacterium sp. MP_3.2 TaxID=3071712 RepID=UPI002DFE8B44|nr:hypothetical protein [Chryseobacterium sp. MP_3.2]